MVTESTVKQKRIEDFHGLKKEEGDSIGRAHGKLLLGLFFLSFVGWGGELLGLVRFFNVSI